MAFDHVYLMPVCNGAVTLRAGRKLGPFILCWRASAPQDRRVLEQMLHTCVTLRASGPSAHGDTHTGKS